MEKPARRILPAEKIVEQGGQALRGPPAVNPGRARARRRVRWFRPTRPWRPRGGRGRRGEPHLPRPSVEVEEGACLPWAARALDEDDAGCKLDGAEPRFPGANRLGREMGLGEPGLETGGTALPVDGLMLEEAGLRRHRRLLPGVSQEAAIEEHREKGPVPQAVPPSETACSPFLVVVLEEPGLDRGGRQHASLEGEVVQVGSQGPFPRPGRLELGPPVIVITDIKCLVELRVAGGVMPHRPDLGHEFLVHALREPKAGLDRRDTLSRRDPEGDGDQAGHVAAEPVHAEARPLLEGGDLVFPEGWLSVVQVHDVRPFTDARGWPPAASLPEPFGMLPREEGVGARVVVDHVDDDLQALGVGRVEEAPEASLAAEGRVDRPVIGDGVGAADLALPRHLPDRMDGRQVDHVEAQPPRRVQGRQGRVEGPRLRVIADEHLVDRLTPEGLVGIGSHGYAPSAPVPGIAK